MKFLFLQLTGPEFLIQVVYVSPLFISVHGILLCYGAQVFVVHDSTLIDNIFSIDPN